MAWLAILALGLAALGAGYGALHYMTAVPGVAHQGPLPALTEEETALAATLRRHVARIAAHEHNLEHYRELEEVARYIEATLASFGYVPGRQEFTVNGKSVRNIDAVIAPATTDRDAEVIVIGAHYDSVSGSPGANDNGSGTAAVIELARLMRDLDGRSKKRIRFVLFVNEEPPYFRTDTMGSVRYARTLVERGEQVVAMYSIETIGFFSSAPGSQKYPPPFGLMFPDRGDFVAFVGLLGSRDLVHRAIRSFRAHTAFPSIGGVAPDLVPGIGSSDHWSFARHGIPALMVTDTAPFRYPHYHETSDTPDKVDTESMARIVKGLERMFRELVR